MTALIGADITIVDVNAGMSDELLVRVGVAAGLDEYYFLEIEFKDVAAARHFAEVIGGRAFTDQAPARAFTDVAPARVTH